MEKDPLQGADIAKVLSSEGPIVKCVVLRAGAVAGTPNTTTINGLKVVQANDNEEDKKPPAKVTKAEEKNDDNSIGNNSNSNNDNDDDDGRRRPILTDLIDEIEIDTTPSKSMVAKILGGSFTFLGQYEEEGVVLMVRDIPQPDSEEEEVEFDREDLLAAKLSTLKSLCKEREIDMTGMLEKDDLVSALLNDSKLPSINPHLLQPPLHNAVVRGDILVLKVAETKEELDEDDDEEKDNQEKEEKEDKTEIEIDVPSNEEFFLDYSKSQYIAFASRTDIEEYEIEEEEEDDGESDGDDDDEGEGSGLEAGFAMGGEEIEEEDKSAMFNLVMNEVLRQYREENGRGPHTHELLELRSTIAKELDVEISDIEIVDWNIKAKANSTNSGRRISFHSEDKVLEFHPDPDEHLRSEEELAYGDYDDDDEEEDDDDDEEDYEPRRKKSKPSEEEEEETEAISQVKQIVSAEQSAELSKGDGNQEER